MIRRWRTRSAGLILLAIVVSLIFHNTQYGPQAGLIAESFGTNIRYSGAGLGYQLASVFAGGPAPRIAAAIPQITGSSRWISIYNTRPGRSPTTTPPADDERGDHRSAARPARRTAPRVSAGRVTCAAFLAPTGAAEGDS